MLGRLFPWLRRRALARDVEERARQTVDDFDEGVPVCIRVPGQQPRYGYVAEILTDRLVVHLDDGGGDVQVSPAVTEYL